MMAAYIQRLKALKQQLWAHRKDLPLPAAAALVFMLFSLGTVLFLTFQSQELRRRAAQFDRNVELVFVSSNTPLYTNTLSAIFIRLNTHGQTIDGAQVVFDLKTDAMDTVTLKMDGTSGLRTSWEKVEGIEGGKRISFAVVSSDPEAGFSNNDTTDIAEVIFTAQRPGTISFVFDDGLTKANAYKELVNVLRPYVVQEFSVATAPAPTPTPVITRQTTTSGTNTSSTTGSSTSNNSTTNTTSSGNTSNTTTTGTGGTSATKGGVTTTTSSQSSPTVLVTISSKQVDTNSTSTASSSASQNSAVAKICNQSCSYSAECGEGFICYQQECRRIGNVTDNTCGANEQTEVKLCNETCTQSSECQGNLLCYQGQCRNASNPENTQCRQSSLDESQIIAELCDSDCVTNTECGDLLSCYRGKCRLPTSPTNQQCIDESDSTSSPPPSSLTEPSPSATPDASNQQSQPSLFSRILRIVLMIGAVIGVFIAGVMGYLWYKDRQTSGL